MDFVPIRARDDAVLRITARQVHTITEPPLRAQITDQLVRYFPARCRYLGAMRLDDAVRAYMQGARHHGMHTEREIAACVHLMFLLGHDMHRDPQLPWVARLLGEDRSPWRRIVAVRAQAMAYLDRIHGRDNAALDRSLARLSRLTAAELEHQVGADTELGTMFALLRRPHPEKVEALGEPLLESLWAENHAQSRSLGLECASRFLSHRQSASRYGFNYPVRVDSTGARKAEVMGQITLHPPNLIVVQTADSNSLLSTSSPAALPAFPDLQAEISDRYTQVWQNDGYIIYQRR